MKWSIWLLPDEKNGVYLQSLINDCCTRFGSQTFDPHVTLFGRVDVEPESAFSFFETICKNQSPISLGVDGIQIGEPPWKALFLQIEKSESLTKFQSIIDAHLNKIRNYDFDPHLSLAYGDLELEKSQIENITFPESIQFSSVALVKTPDEISSWRTLLTFPLGG